jgi:hypothetical protein
MKWKIYIFFIYYIIKFEKKNWHKRFYIKIKYRRFIFIYYKFINITIIINREIHLENMSIMFVFLYEIYFLTFSKLLFIIIL